MGENEGLKALKCPQCGGDLVKSYRVEYDEGEEENINIPVAKCVSCGTEYDQYTQEYYQVFADDLTYDKDNTVFKLGIKGVLNDVEYEIIGRIRYQEEDEYEKSTWDEWFAVSSDGAYHYFVEEEGKVHSYEEYVPKSIDMESDPSYIEFEGKKIPKTEGYVARIVLGEGELPWVPEIGEPVMMYDFKKEGDRYTIEHSENEVSITRGDRISYDDIVAAFGDEENKILYETTMKKRKTYKRKAIIYLLGFILMLGLSLYGCFSSTPVPGIMDKSMVLASNTGQVDQGQLVYISQALYGPFEINKGSSLYNVDVSIDENIQRLNLEWQSFRFMLVPVDRLMKAANNQLSAVVLKDLFSEIDAMKDPVECYSVSGDFWDEEGYDSDGYWHENILSVDDNFKLDKAGKYYAYLELYSKKPRVVNSVKIKLKRVKSYRYYVIILVVMAALLVVNRSKSRSYNELPFEVAPE
jgi:hypothetical protein